VAIVACLSGSSALSSNEARADVAKRPVPDYGGTEQPSCAICWPARVALFPLRMANEILLRQPLGFLLRTGEKEEPISADDTSEGHEVAPVFAIDPGFDARFGLTGTVRDGAVRVPMLAEGGRSTYTFAVAPSVVMPGTHAGTTVGAFALLARRPDAIYAWTGTRVAIDRGETGFRTTGRLGSFFTVGAAVGMRGVRVDTAPVQEDYVAVFQRLDVVFDSTREKHPREKSTPRSIRTDGVRIALAGEHAATAADREQWVSYGGTLLGSLDTGLARIIELSATIRMVDPIASPHLPWTEQLPLGGDILRGHLEGRARGRSVMVYGAQWRWPVWTFLEGFLLGELGNAFDKHFENLTLKRMRISAVAGMRHQSLSGYVFEIMSGIGTDTIEANARVSSVRFLFAASRAL
jgi:hypothetical protein